MIYGTVIICHSLGNDFRKHDSLSVKNKGQFCLVEPISVPRICKYLISSSVESKRRTLEA